MGRAARNPAPRVPDGQPPHGVPPDDGRLRTSTGSVDEATTVASASHGRQRRPGLRTVPAAVAAGYRRSPGPERVVSGMTVSFAVTITVSRTLNYILERRRAMPRLRGLGRLLVPGRNKPRVHHYFPGMNLAFIAGGTGLIARAGTLDRWLSLPFGVGVALTTDEVGILLSRNNPYWGGTRAAQRQVAASSIATLGFALDFLRRGRNCGGESA